MDDSSPHHDSIGQGKEIRVGVLSIQGAFAEHAYNLQQAFELLPREALHVVRPHKLLVIEVRRPEQLDDLHGLILPGGESTTASKFLTKAGFQERLTEWVTGKGKKTAFTWGTCAGLILLGNRTEDTKSGGQLNIGGLDITVTRNKFGRQNDSFQSAIVLHDRELRGPGPEKYPGVFIRAPGIKSIDSAEVEVLASLEVKDNSIPVAVKQGDIMATSFHPELTDDLRWHFYFIRQVALRVLQQDTLSIN